MYIYPNVYHIRLYLWICDICNSVKHEPQLVNGSFLIRPVVGSLKITQQPIIYQVLRLFQHTFGTHPGQPLPTGHKLNDSFHSWLGGTATNVL